MSETKMKLSSSYVKAPEVSSRTPGLTTIPQVLKHFAENCPDKEAVVFVSTSGGRESVTYKELYERSKTVAHNFIKLGLKSNEIIAINLRTCPQWLYTNFGSIMAGAIPIGIVFTYNDGSDLVALMEKLEKCSCLVMDSGLEDLNWNILTKVIDEYYPDGSVMSKQMPSLRYLVCHDQESNIKGVKPFKDLLTGIAGEQELPEPLESDVAVLFQTSGSTGIPKAVAHTHDSILTTTRLAGEEHSERMIYFCDRPFGWIGGYPFSVLQGQTRVTCSGFCTPPRDRAKFMTDVVMQERCTVLATIPSLLHNVNARGEFCDSWPVQSLFLAGQPITKQVIASITGRLSNSICTAYCATEMLMVSEATFTNPDEFIEYSCGVATPGMELKVVNSEEKTVPVNMSGEIYAKGKSLFREYVNDPEKTAAAFTDDGWFKTDDIGRLLEDGSVIVEGRKSNMIISGTMNVSPEILEKLLLRCPGIEGCVIVPVPDDILHQVICACVKVVPGDDVNEAVVRKFCEDMHADKLGLFTVLPKYYLFLESFPETRTGKISRQELATLVKDMFKI